MSQGFRWTMIVSDLTWQCFKNFETVKLELLGLARMERVGGKNIDNVFMLN